MVTIVEDKTHLNDAREIIAVSAKAISSNLSDYPLVSTVVAAIHSTTLLTDDLSSALLISVDRKRNNVVDFKIKLQKRTLTRHDVANFFDTLQKAIDESKLF